MDILEACRTPAIEYWIMIKARLGYETFSKYRDKLLREGKMISLYSNANGRASKTYYSLTQEGIQMLEELKTGRVKKANQS